MQRPCACMHVALDNLNHERGPRWTHKEGFGGVGLCHCRGEARVILRVAGERRVEEEEGGSVGEEGGVVCDDQRWNSDGPCCPMLLHLREVYAVVVQGSAQCADLAVLEDKGGVGGRRLHGCRKEGQGGSGRVEQDPAHRHILDSLVLPPCA